MNSIPTPEAGLPQSYWRRIRLASYLLAGGALLFILQVHLVPALISALLVHELVHVLAARLPKKIIINQKATLMAVLLLAAVIVGGLTALTLGLLAFLHSDAGSVPALMAKLAEILDRSRDAMPNAIRDLLPVDTENMRKDVVTWLRTHAEEMQHFGRAALHIAAQIIIGIILGVIAAIQEISNGKGGPLTRALGERLLNFTTAFRQVVFAQAKISAINAAATGVYLGIVLPLLGVHLPFVKTMIVLTFFFSLIPVVGNLISNTMIVLISLGHSAVVAVGSLIYLVAIHKIEYFLNARIVGSAIRARAIELLIAMLALEAAFGLAGVVLAPILYAYLKIELSLAGLV